jgi:tRNA nucleotidyltransferase (CCA-adding enzyme)
VTSHRQSRLSPAAAGSATALLAALPPARRRLARTAARLARSMQVPLYLIGGSVRDLLLGVPSPDLDLCVVGDGHAFARSLARELSAPVTEDRRFLTAKIEAAGGVIDVATARRETYAHPGALPRVAPGTIDDDLARRDFTVNAIAVRLGRPRAHALVDPFGGRADLKRRRLRVLHERSFTDDPTRLLRAARYVARLSFAWERSTRRLAQQAVGEGCLDTVSGERIRRELMMLLAEPRADAGIALLARLGALRALHPAWETQPRMRAQLRLAGSLCERFSPGTDGAHINCGVVRLLVLCQGLSPSHGHDLGERLRLPARQRDALTGYLAARSRVGRILSAPRLSNGAVVRALEGLALEAVVALATTSGARVRRRCELFMTSLRHVRPHIGGEDLAVLGFPPGPGWSRALSAARDARLDGKAQSKDDELRIARRVLKRSRSDRNSPRGRA